MTRSESRRRELRLTQRTLGVRSGLHQSTISLVERRRYAPSPGQLARLAAALGVEVPRTLLDEVESAPTRLTVSEWGRP